MKKSKIKLSQCMIVKNEERNIERALSWGKDFVYEQIVVDTGSTDKTVELAQQMGAKVFHYTWNDDFSAAKNYAIEQASGNWIAFLDADEYFSQECAKKLIPLLEKIHTDKNIDLVRMEITNLDDQGGIIGTAHQDRVFRNDPRLRYRNRIHEALHKTGKTPAGCCNAENWMMILHTGYSEQNKNGAEKGLRNIRLLKKQLEDNPRDAMCMMYLGDSYILANQEDEALKYFRRVLTETDLEISSELAPLRSGLQMMAVLLGKLPEGSGEEFFWTANELRKRGMDQHPDVDYLEGFWYLRLGHMVDAAKLFERALEKMETYVKVDEIRLTANLEIVCNAIAYVALEADGNLQKAVQFSVTALRSNKYSPDGIQTLLKTFLTEFSVKGDAKIYWQFLSRLYDLKGLKDLLFIHEFAKTVGFSQLADLALQALPEEAREELQKN